MSRWQEKVRWDEKPTSQNDDDNIDYIDDDEEPDHQGMKSGGYSTYGQKQNTQSYQKNYVESEGNKHSGKYHQNNKSYSNGQQNKFAKKDEGPARLYRPYVFTSDKEIPEKLLKIAMEFMSELEDRDYVLRCSVMNPVELSAKDNIKKAENLELYLPWKEFGNLRSKYEYTPENAKVLASQFNPKYETLKPGPQTFLAKNVRLLLGTNLKSRAMFVLIYTPDGAESKDKVKNIYDFTANIILIAESLNIPVFNLYNDDVFMRLSKYLNFQ